MSKGTKKGYWFRSCKWSLQGTSFTQVTCIW